MTTFTEQITAARSAHTVVNALEVAARSKIDTILADWDSGKLDALTVRHQLERTVRDTYRASVAVAVTQVGQQMEIPGWKPQERVFATPYLKSLISDVQSNLRAFKKDGKTEVARRRAALRFKHSAGVAAQRGYTDALIGSYEEMAKFGLTLRKVWTANFVGHTPCDHCYSLSGTEVGLRAEFPPSPGHAPYLDLQGPPAHPQCQCCIVILVTALENWDEELPPSLEDKPKTPREVPHPRIPDRVPAKPNTPETTLPETKPPVPAKPAQMSSKTVRSMAGPVFAAFIAFLGKIIKMLRGA